ncbi:MAG: hypothetical protein ABJB86_09915 [Bacteroidota bacterium]
MRATGLILLFISFISLQAQTQVPSPVSGYRQQGSFTHSNLQNDSNHLNQKWSVSVYGGMAASIGFFGNGTAAFLPLQIGLQLNRRLNNNLYAFAGISAAPAYFNFNRSFNNTEQYKSFMTSSGFGNNGYGIYPGIQAGLMYVNDAKTFSISGSIGISNSTYPVYHANKTSTQKQPFTGLSH